MADRLRFVCNGSPVEVDAEPGESLLSVLRERLLAISVKDGCAPQGQCGCCTVLVDGDPRVACVTPATRVAGRSVTTVEGLDDATRDALARGFVDTGGSQCGFCTPGIVMRAAAMMTKGRTARVDLDRSLAAHLCRCTGWRTVYEAIDAAASPVPPSPSRDLDAAGRRAALEGGTPQRVGPD
ncbi:MAG: (2Fe-2S)-binding protein, partial [Acidimicrobiia bacterium]